MGHAEHGLGLPGHGGGVDHGVEQRHGRLGPLQAEPLLADVLGLEELLERLGGVQAIEDPALLLGAELGGDAFDVVLDPPLLVGLLDVHVLDADGPAVGVAQHAEDVAEASCGPARRGRR